MSGINTDKRFVADPGQTCISKDAFSWSDVEFVNLERTNIKKIGKHAFYKCYKLVEIVFPSSLEKICKEAFSFCQSLRNIIFPSDSKLKKIGTSAFSDCCEIESFEFPPLLEIIDDFAFNCCNCLKTFDLSKTMIKHIGITPFGGGGYALGLRNKSNITVILPSTVTTRSIINCQYYQLTISDNQFVKKDECGYYIINTTILYANKNKKHFLIRRGVERIEKLCFYRCGIISITIPDSVTTISDFAFEGCSLMRHIRFEDNSKLELIGIYAFRACSSLKKIKFPRSLKLIKLCAFLGCYSLKKVDFHHDFKGFSSIESFLRTNIEADIILSAND